MKKPGHSPELTSAAPKAPLPSIGWREYVELPDLKVARIKAKVDTGARTSALHATNITYEVRQGLTVVVFDVHPRQRDGKKVVRCEALLVEERHVRDSGGKGTLRPVILTSVVLRDRWLKVELTLVSRDTMGFRMLIGRQAIRGVYVVDPGKSYLGGRKKKLKSKRAVAPKRK